MRRHYARRSAGGARGGDAQVVAGGARGGGRQRTRRRSEVGAHCGEAVEEGRRCCGGPRREEPRAAAPWPSWGKKGKGEGTTSGSYMSDQFFVEWRRE